MLLRFSWDATAWSSNDRALCHRTTADNPGRPIFNDVLAFRRQSSALVQGSRQSPILRQDHKLYLGSTIPYEKLPMYQRWNKKKLMSGRREMMMMMMDDEVWLVVGWCCLSSWVLEFLSSWVWCGVKLRGPHVPVRGRPQRTENTKSTRAFSRFPNQNCEMLAEDRNTISSFSL